MTSLRAPVVGRARVPRGAVVALSGLDGAGKSTQGEALVQALNARGFDAVVCWQRLSYDDGLKRLTAPIRFLLRLALRLRPSIVPPAEDSLAGGGVLPEFAVLPEHAAARRLRERMPRVSALWVTLVALSHAVSVRRETLREVRQGRIVVRDRYLLDSLVHLQDRYARVGDVDRQAALLRRLTPSPVCALYLDVSAQEAYRRTPEEYTVDRLAAHRTAYLEQAARLGVLVVDAERPVDVIAAQVLAAVDAALVAAEVRPGR